MLKWIIRGRLAAFEKQNGYDMSYAREILDADTGAFMKFAKLGGMSEYRKDLPKPVYWAVKLVGTLAEDCGPCTQLCVTMALRDGVAGAELAAVIAGDAAKMSEDVALGVRFGRAALAHDLDADDARDAIDKKWGKRAVVSASFALVIARVYPTLKYALGHGKACARVMIDGKAIVPKSADAIARA